MKITALLFATCATLAVAAPSTESPRNTNIYCFIDKRDPTAGYKRCPPAEPEAVGIEARNTNIYCFIDKRNPHAGFKRCPPAAPEGGVEARNTNIYCFIDKRDASAGFKRCPPAAPAE
ncbi:hypothetical protein BGZ63DRAFT_401976 [Mariannaea sp. PMI_226]|nr:hypothetical protein BGZ63DRAFT_401976 [Mariannaea sp. PMI_226]